MSDTIPDFTDGIDRYSGPADNGVSAEHQELVYRFIRDHEPMKPWTIASRCEIPDETAKEAIRAIVLDGYVSPTATGDLRIDESDYPN